MSPKLETIARNIINDYWDEYYTLEEPPKLVIKEEVGGPMSLRAIGEADQTGDGKGIVYLPTKYWEPYLEINEEKARKALAFNINHEMAHIHTYYSTPGMRGKIGSKWGEATADGYAEKYTGIDQERFDDMIAWLERRRRSRTQTLRRPNAPVIFTEPRVIEILPK